MLRQPDPVELFVVAAFFVAVLIVGFYGAYRLGEERGCVAPSAGWVTR